MEVLPQNICKLLNPLIWKWIESLTFESIKLELHINSIFLQMAHLFHPSNCSSILITSWEKLFHSEKQRPSCPTHPQSRTHAHRNGCFYISCPTLPPSVINIHPVVCSSACKSGRGRKDKGRIFSQKQHRGYEITFEWQWYTFSFMNVQN